MTKGSAAALVFAALVAPGAAPAETNYQFTVKNDTGAALAVTVDGKPACKAAAGKSCIVKLPNADDHHFAYKVGGGASISFAPGNLENVSLCTIDPGGAHCIDRDGEPTN
jgi:hypothetical protein